ncbi:MAG: endonuclease domain-containing protein [Candidatus Marinimicrobia bacterium]|jgi:very-short-patch-repair endonuclease|nr:endonuclease domain-containing protein [Candidatus Neomarinimicrobiota bacterium]MBT3501558.1 endonuclease domain-containing protein [Candidatus Neomarinimicrobiota bacterium]MBT3838711.1 endonuclease domain-containing protein [Candidatus Neomarinimicrobiota bacterium]MBT3998390.1 endonuclease domain-containing protein [Candidatus Neomarinimicrobiota bacterium]MBT4282425.1 endonuclease domain-containing protein [Candidatus Neomarinimicrobiota bacterium]
MKNAKEVNKQKLKTIRRLNRNQPTPWELKLWQYLKETKMDGYKFRRQVSIDNYVVDFCCLDLKLVIELDGSGHLHPKQQMIDKGRSNDLESWGYTLIRFFNNEIDDNLNEVLEIISSKCKELE